MFHVLLVKCEGLGGMVDLFQQYGEIVTGIKIVGVD